MYDFTVSLTINTDIIWNIHVQFLIAWCRISKIQCFWMGCFSIFCSIYSMMIGIFDFWSNWMIWKCFFVFDKVCLSFAIKSAISLFGISIWPDIHCRFMKNPNFFIILMFFRLSRVISVLWLFLIALNAIWLSKKIQVSWFSIFSVFWKIFQIQINVFQIRYNFSVLLKVIFFRFQFFFIFFSLSKQMMFWYVIWFL